MNTKKSWLLSFVLFSILSTAAIANGDFVKEPVKLNKQIYKLLKGVEIQVEESSTIYVDFMINERSEIIVLSTSSNKSLDYALKSRLNYKTLETSELEYFKKYTVPVRFDKR